eukprot:279030-Chlamydomonas_euryale.AAC.1
MCQPLCGWPGHIGAWCGDGRAAILSSPLHTSLVPHAVLVRMCTSKSRRPHAGVRMENAACSRTFAPCAVDRGAPPRQL